MLAEDAHCLFCGAEEVIVYFGFACNVVGWSGITKQLLLENNAYSLPYHNSLRTTVPYNLHRVADWDGRLKMLVASVVKWGRFPEFPFLCMHKAICKASVLEIQ